MGASKSLTDANVNNSKLEKCRCDTYATTQGNYMIKQVFVLDITSGNKCFSIEIGGNL